MLSVLFWIFSTLMVISGLGVILARNPITSAINLVVSFLFLSCLFFTLDAFFLGIIQILISAGAVVVLFLFIIMLLDIRSEERRRIQKTAFFGGVLSSLMLLIVIGVCISLVTTRKSTAPLLSESLPSDVNSLGMLLFSDYSLLFQIVGVLLLVATIGAVLLSKKELK